MQTSLAKAISIYKAQNLSCVICCGEEMYIAAERGIKPLLRFIDEGLKLQGAVAADKIVGRAAALLYIHMGIKAIYAEVLSEGAVELLSEHNIAHHYETLTPIIRNREDTDSCPMEMAVMGINDTNAAVMALKDKLAELQNTTAKE